MQQTAKESRPTRPVRRRWQRVLKTVARGVFVAVVLYLAVILLGLIPVNNDFEPTPEGIEVFFISSAIHADVVLPVETDTIDWRAHFPADCFSDDTAGATPLPKTMFLFLPE